jgi:sensor domain CHASE-containing protein
MFVNNEITERGRLHKLLHRVADEVTMEERRVWAHSIDAAIQDAASAVRLRNRVAQRAVVLGAAPALSAVAAALRNEDVVVSREGLNAVRAFLTDGIDSPLYGRDPLAARRGADALRRQLVGAEAAQRATAATAA